MNGLELSRLYYEQCARPMLEEQFSALLPFLAFGLTGPGSECYGFDDERSRDHDFEPGFCIFLPEEAVVDRRSAFLLERAYAKLPREFLGFERPRMLPVGGARRGVFRTEEFYQKAVGSSNGVLSVEQWLRLPEFRLAEAVNGEIFDDPWGEVTQIRTALSRYPEDIFLKRLAGQLLQMAQAGPYNYPRCLSHGETGAAQLAAVEFAKSAMSALFLLNRRYQPYYKWSFRALRALPKLSALSESLEDLISSPNKEENARKKLEGIARISAAVVCELRAQSLSNVLGEDLERHAYAVNDRIRDAWLRNLHVLAAV